MARATRIDFNGAWHHVMHRGARRAPVFRDQQDCTGFLDIVGEMVQRFGLEVHAYALMPNHYHLLVRSPMGNLSKAMQYLNGTFTLWLNNRNKWDGPVFRGRFRSQLVIREEHLRYLVAYIHLNPVVAHLVRRLVDEAWTSHRAYIGKETAPSWLTTAHVCELLGGPEKLHSFVLECRRGGREYPTDIDNRTGLWKPKPGKEPGSLLADLPSVPAPAWSQPTRRRLSADEVLRQVQQVTGATIEDLKRKESGPGANPARRFAIWALNQSGEISQREIAALLDVPYYQVTRLLGRLRKLERKPPLAGWIKAWPLLEE